MVVCVVETSHNLTLFIKNLRLISEVIIIKHTLIKYIFFIPSPFVYFVYDKNEELLEKIRKVNGAEKKIYYSRKNFEFENFGGEKKKDK